MSGNNYFYFDGSALLNDIVRMRKTSNGRYVDRRLNLSALVKWFAYESLTHFHQDSYRRATFYFVRDDARVSKLLEIPDYTKPDVVNDLRIEWCGKRVAPVEAAARWLEDNNAPPEVLESLHRSEKAVDTQICCDALQLAALSKLDRLFLYTNDYDFVPLVRTLRHLGCNTNLIRLSADRVNQDLVEQCDGFGTVPPYKLDEWFKVLEPPAEPA